MLKLMGSHFILLIMLVLFSGSALFANKSSVKIDIPAEVKKGEKILIKVTVSHNGNNVIHYTDWVYVKAGNKEIARWEYSMFSRPDSEVFTKEVTYTVKETVEIEAQANCNLHGSAGKGTVTVKVMGD